MALPGVVRQAAHGRNPAHDVRNKPLTTFGNADVSKPVYHALQVSQLVYHMSSIRMRRWAQKAAAFIAGGLVAVVLGAHNPARAQPAAFDEFQLQPTPAIIAISPFDFKAATFFSFWETIG
jgi:hypothetical protein